MARLDLVNDLQAILNGELRAEQFVVLGRGLGDSIDGLPAEWISSGEPRMGGTRRYSDGKVEIQREGETEFSPYSPAEQYADCCKHGGRVRLKPPSKPGVEVLLTAMDGRITEVFLMGAWLGKLGCRTEADLLTRFGETDYRSHSHGFSKYGWPDRGIVANRYRDRLFSIVLGELDLKELTLSAVDLIRAALDWNDRHPGHAWPLTPTSGSESSRVEAERLEALLRAFGLAAREKKLLRGVRWSPSNPLESFFEGGFLASASGDHVERVSAYLADPANGLPRQLERAGHAELAEDVQRFWVRMLRFRQHLHEVRKFNSGVLEAGWGYFLLSVQVSGGIARSLDAQVDVLDRALACLIDPDQQAIPWAQLVRDYGYPDADYEELRMGEI